MLFATRHDIDHKAECVHQCANLPSRWNDRVHVVEKRAEKQPKPVFYNVKDVIIMIIMIESIPQGLRSSGRLGNATAIALDKSVKLVILEMALCIWSPKIDLRIFVCLLKFAQFSSKHLF